MIIERKNRWVFAFADLSLLMIGYFVIMMNASPSLTDATIPLKSAENEGASISLRSKDLFAEHEAMISDEGKSVIADFLVSNKVSNQRIKLSLNGWDPASERLDGWELAAARLAATGRVIREQGIEADSIHIGLIDQSNIEDEQNITIRVQSGLSGSK